MTDNADNRTLADQYADAVREKKDLETKVLFLRAKILSLGMSELQGQYCVVQVSKRKQRRIDTTKVREILTPEQLEACLFDREVEVVNVKEAPHE